jgi:hypothetical protein
MESINDDDFDNLRYQVISKNHEIAFDKVLSLDVNKKVSYIAYVSSDNNAIYEQEHKQKQKQDHHMSKKIMSSTSIKKQWKKLSAIEKTKKVEEFLSTCEKNIIPKLRFELITKIDKNEDIPYNVETGKIAL